MRVLNKEDLKNIIYGCAVLGTGGGGRLEDGLKIVLDGLDQGLVYKLAELNEIPDEGYVAVAYECGAVSPRSESQLKYKEIDDAQTVKAFKTMEEYYGQHFYGVISTELGAENTAVAFKTASQLERLLIDADLAGRSVPGVEHTLYNLFDIPIQPISLANKYGDTMIITDVVDDFRAEAIVRAVASVSGNEIGVVDHPVKGKIMKKIVINKAISYAEAIGSKLRVAIKNNLNPAKRIIREFNGKLLFEGTVSEASYSTENGYTIGEFLLEGVSEYFNSTYKVWYKNENIITYLNDQVDVTVPDLICVLKKDGNPLNNPYARVGDCLTVFALPAPKEWTTKKGLEIFGPKSFGFNVDYRPYSCD